MTTPKEPTTQVVTVYRLSASAYQQLERVLPSPYTDNETTAIAAGYKLGIQAALKALREGFVVEH